MWTKQKCKCRDCFFDRLYFMHTLRLTERVLANNTNNNVRIIHGIGDTRKFLLRPPSFLQASGNSLKVNLFKSPIHSSLFH